MDVSGVVALRGRTSKHSLIQRMYQVFPLKVNNFVLLRDRFYTAL
jgi:hypothetical protein